jgi:hypothetical protein
MSQRVINIKDHNLAIWDGRQGQSCQNFIDLAQYKFSDKDPDSTNDSDSEALNRWRLGHLDRALGSELEATYNQILTSSSFRNSLRGRVIVRIPLEGQPRVAVSKSIKPQLTVNDSWRPFRSVISLPLIDLRYPEREVVTHQDKFSNSLIHLLGLHLHRSRQDDSDQSNIYHDFIRETITNLDQATLTS